MVSQFQQRLSSLLGIPYIQGSIPQLTTPFSTNLGELSAKRLLQFFIGLRSEYLLLGQFFGVHCLCRSAPSSAEICGARISGHKAVMICPFLVHSLWPFVGAAVFCLCPLWQLMIINNCYCCRQKQFRGGSTSTCTDFPVQASSQRSKVGRRQHHPLCASGSLGSAAAPPACLVDCLHYRQWNNIAKHTHTHTRAHCMCRPISVPPQQQQQLVLHTEKIISAVFVLSYQNFYFVKLIFHLFCLNTKPCIRTPYQIQFRATSWTQISSLIMKTLFQNVTCSKSTNQCFFRFRDKIK